MEKERKFTPGPCHFDWHGINDSESGERIAKVSLNQYGPDGALDEKFLAYSLIFAAAPEMLEALEYVKVYFDAYGCDNVATYGLVREAIEKAIEG